MQACASAGLGEAEVPSIDIPTRFASFEDYWQPFLERLPRNSDGSIALVARAWAVKA